MTLETVNMANPAQNTSTGGAGGDLPVSPDMSQDDQNDVKQILSTYKKWKAVRDLYSKPWMNYYKLTRGNQWGAGRGVPWKAQEVVNLIWQTIQSSVPLQTDARPKFIFLPAEPTDLPFSNLIEKISDMDFNKWGWMRTVMEVIFDGYVYGTGCSSMKYDPRLLYGIGAPVYKSEEPFYIIPDPDCNDINDDDSEGLFHAYPMTTSKLKAKYPKFAAKIKPDCKDWLKGQKTDIKSDQFYQFNKSPNHQMPDMTMLDGSDEVKLEKTLVIEAFLKPNELEEVVTNEPNEQGIEERTYTVKKKYPRGRHVIIANGIKIHDGDLPFDDLLIPYHKYINYTDPREFWGISEVEQLESPQRVLNRILSYAIDIILYCSNPGWIVSTDCDYDPDNMTNKPGQIIEKSPEGTINRVEGSQLPGHFMAILDRLVNWFNDIAGRTEFSQGKAEGGVTAASAIEQLMEAARTRIRQKQRNLDVYMKDVGRQYLNRVLQFYTVPRIYRMTKDDGSQFWIKFHVEKRKDPTGQREDPIMAAVLESYHYDDQGQIISGEPQIAFLRGELDVEVRAGSDLPFEASDKERKALALFDRGIIDAQEVLDQIQYPNKEKVLARLATKQQQAAAAQAQAPQQGA